MRIFVHRAFPAFRLFPLDTFPGVGLLGHRIWTFLIACDAWCQIALQKDGIPLLLCVFDNGLHNVETYDSWDSLGHLGI